ncbi:MAG: protein translocase subunit SecD [bacterium]|nr:protein translocase subunit SecD [bacterium]
MKPRISAVLLIALGMLAGYFVAPIWGISERLQIPFRLGLDLQGGTNLIYSIDTSEIPSFEHAESIEGLRDVIERRVNLFGVSEPLVRHRTLAGEDLLSVQLAGVFDIDQAISLIGQTPFLEFRVEDPNVSTSTLASNPDAFYTPTELTGRFLERASLEFGGSGGSQHIGGGLQDPYIVLRFNKEGGDLFEQITGANIGRTIAIYLDGVPISAPVVQDVITGDTATITGQFEAEEARLLVQRLNSGALPVPIELISQERVEPAHGAESLEKSFYAGLIGLIMVALFMIVWYRLPGLIAVLALGIYTALTLTVFKLIPVTFTTAGIAGFVLSIGMAVDANILIFERMKEELRRGRSLGHALEEGFLQAWTAIRDSNVSSLLTALILWYFGTDAVKGFALTLGIGIALSMFSAIVISRTFLRSIISKKMANESKAPTLYQSGLGQKS